MIVFTELSSIIRANKAKKGKNNEQGIKFFRRVRAKCRSAFR